MEPLLLLAGAAILFVIPAVLTAVFRSRVPIEHGTLRGFEVLPPADSPAVKPRGFDVLPSPPQDSPDA
jgi:hypothetical protein